MVNPYTLLFFILALIVIGKMEVEGGPCSQPLGGCKTIGECDQRCKALHVGGLGSCDLNVCTCFYHCEPPHRPNPPDRRCTGGLGLCSGQCNDACCNSKCANRYYQGVGFCDTLGTTNLCTCKYVCT